MDITIHLLKINHIHTIHQICITLDLYICTPTYTPYILAYKQVYHIIMNTDIAIYSIWGNNMFLTCSTDFGTAPRMNFTPFFSINTPILSAICWSKPRNKMDLTCTRKKGEGIIFLHMKSGIFTKKIDKCALSIRHLQLRFPTIYKLNNL